MSCIHLQLLLRYSRKNSCQNKQSISRNSTHFHPLPDTTSFSHTNFKKLNQSNVSVVKKGKQTHQSKPLHFPQRNWKKIMCVFLRMFYNLFKVRYVTYGDEGVLCSFLFCRRNPSNNPSAGFHVSVAVKMRLNTWKRLQLAVALIYYLLLSRSL